MEAQTLENGLPVVLGPPFPNQGPSLSASVSVYVNIGSGSIICKNLASQANTWICWPLKGGELREGSG